MGILNHSSVLIISDDPEFARTIVARWQAERHVPEITLVTGDVWRPAGATDHDLVIVGPVREGRLPAILPVLVSAPGTAVLCVANEGRDVSLLGAEYPSLLIVPKQDGWMRTLILLSAEALRRVEAVARAQRAERVALECQLEATLGRYMLEMRPSVNNTLTSILGNADLLLLEPGQVSGETRGQIRTIHTMALRLNEIMQRFSSLSAEMRAGEKESQPETETVSRG
jgi:signal transduction histidine kinase